MHPHQRMQKLIQRQKNNSTLFLLDTGSFYFDPVFFSFHINPGIFFLPLSFQKVTFLSFEFEFSIFACIILIIEIKDNLFNTKDLKN